MSATAAFQKVILVDANTVFARLENLGDPGEQARDDYWNGSDHYGVGQALKELSSPDVKVTFLLDRERTRVNPSRDMAKEKAALDTFFGTAQDVVDYGSADMRTTEFWRRRMRGLPAENVMFMTAEAERISKPTVFGELKAENICYLGPLSSRGSLYSPLQHLRNFVQVPVIL